MSETSYWRGYDDAYQGGPSRSDQDADYYAGYAYADSCWIDAPENPFPDPDPEPEKEEEKP